MCHTAHQLSCLLFLPQFVKLLIGQVEKLVKILQTKEKLLEGSQKDLKQLQWVCVFRRRSEMRRRLKQMAMSWTYVCTYSQRLLFPFQGAIFVRRFLYLLFTHKLHTNYLHVSYILLCSCLFPHDRVSQQERLLHSASTAVSLLWHSYMHTYIQSTSDIPSRQFLIHSHIF